MATATKTTKKVQVLATYRFTKISRICFTVLSSNGSDKYNTCFDGSADKGSCTCPSKSPKGCYHLNQLRPVAQVYFESRKEAARQSASKPVATVKIDNQIIEVTANVETGKITSTPCKGEAVADPAVDKAAVFASLFKKYDVRQQTPAPMNNLFASQVEAIMRGQKVQVAPGAFCLAR